MPHCYSYQQGGEMDSVKRVRTYYSPFGQIDQTYARRWGHYTYRNLPKIYDAHIITAEYLIDNIDRAFDNWQKRPWNRSLSFEDFCEYLLFFWKIDARLRGSHYAIWHNNFVLQHRC